MRHWVMGVVVGAFAGTVALAGCGSSGGGTSNTTGAASAATSAGQSAGGPHTVDLGAGPIKVGNGPLKIAFFTAGSTNAYLKSFNDAAKSEASKLGASLTTFDGNFDASTQSNQISQALASNRYNAWIMDPIPPGSCNLIKQAISSGIIISAVNQTLCGKPSSGGEASWLPGTVNYVAGDQTEDVFTSWLMKIGSENASGPQHMVVLEGPPGQVQTTSTENAIKKVKAKYSNIKVTSVQVPGYALAAAESQMSALIRSTPDMTIVAGNYSDLTQGAVGALQAAGKLKNVKVYDAGGDKWAVQSVKDGLLQFTLPFLPATETQLSVQSLVNTWQGKGPGPHWVDILKTVTVPGGPFISKSNVDQFTAQY